MLIKNEKAYSILEMAVSIFIFSLIMLTIMALLNIGLKSWQIGETSIDSQNSAQVALNRLTQELKLSCISSCVYDPNGYIAFDSALDDTGTFRIDSVTRSPLWQTYIIYYTYRQKPTDKFLILYRQKKGHISSPVPKQPSVGNNSSFDFDVSAAGDSRIMAKSVENFDITTTGDLVNIHLICTRNVGDKKLPYEQDFDPNKVKASIEVFTAVNPRNY